jgi:hypothetical protein
MKSCYQSWYSPLFSRSVKNPASRGDRWPTVGTTDLPGNHLLTYIAVPPEVFRSTAHYLFRPIAHFTSLGSSRWLPSDTPDPHSRCEMPAIHCPPLEERPNSPIIGLAEAVSRVLLENTQIEAVREQFPPEPLSLDIAGIVLPSDLSRGSNRILPAGATRR